MANDDDTELWVAIVALIIAVIAFVATVIQLAQSIIATARGLPNCDERVMGKWASFSSRKFKWWQLRLEVDFEAPVIFLAATDNTRGPVKDKHGDDADIWYANGSKESCDDFRVNEFQDDDPFKQGLGRERVHTVDNELATWITLLGAIQKMEKDSRLWESRKWKDSSVTQPNPPGQLITLAVGVQSKKRSFDAVPTIKKPYATTTISHLIELAAVLGLYWKDFNRDENKYRAEGNGYSLLGTRLDDFGIVFGFERTGWANFEETRIIPTHEVKELCFGNIPTFFREKDRKSDDMWNSRITEQRTLQTLRLGSRQEIIDTLSLIGCNTNTTLYYLKDGHKHTHLFPVTFEIVGMLGRPLHVMNRAFTFLPNPTIFAWNSQTFDLRRLLSEFVENLRLNMDASSRNRHTLSDDLEEIRAIAGKLDRELPKSKLQFTPQHLNEIHKAIDATDIMLSEEKKDKNVVLDVLRRHIQEVLLAINTTAEQAAVSPTSPSPIVHAISFDDLLGVPPENREREFMAKYFNQIRLRVINIGLLEHEDPQVAEASLHIHTSSPQQRQEITRDEDLDSYIQQQQSQPASAGDVHPSVDSAVPSSTLQDTVPSPPSSPPEHNSPRFSAGGPPRPIRTDTIGLGLGSRSGTMQGGRATTWGTTMSDRFEPRRNDIWSTLVFRMLCWLLLHDFGKKDVQMSKSELLGSRLPVYIM
ncbi:hypothetical protein BJ170DRAFT_44056 [Xylariales sp. AK1849]|nr:hypothetical protein BJ170DRAFT_44056 [Xylariales sp. AK1849]